MQGSFVLRGLESGEIFKATVRVSAHCEARRLLGCVTMTSATYLVGSTQCPHKGVAANFVP